MDLQTLPLHGEIELLFQLFDDALADIAEGSDVIGKDRNTNTHGIPLSPDEDQHSCHERERRQHCMAPAEVNAYQRDEACKNEPDSEDNIGGPGGKLLSPVRCDQKRARDNGDNRKDR
jgi:hypothetical protein